MNLIAVRRDDRFSPNSVEKDRLILEAACIMLCSSYEQQGEPAAYRWVDEAELTAADEADIYLSMARLPEALNILEGFERQGRCVVNGVQGVRNCQRSKLEQLMRANHVAMPAEIFVDANDLQHGVWLKRGDVAAQSKEDVVFCKDGETLRKAISVFESRGICDYVVSRHVEGDVVKFYGVSAPPVQEGQGRGFFRFYYPTDDGQTKFGDEAAHNGQAHHYDFDSNLLQIEVERLAQLVGVAVYGGDAIIDAEGHFYIIDFNDWPSFSRCRDEASSAISSLFIPKS